MAADASVKWTCNTGDSAERFTNQVHPGDGGPSLAMAAVIRTGGHQWAAGI